MYAACRRAALYHTAKLQKNRLPRAARQVGWAIAKSEIDIPWQRVVKADGAVAGGEHAQLRRALLEAEGVGFLPDGRVDMEKYKLWEEYTMSWICEHCHTINDNNSQICRICGKSNSQYNNLNMQPPYEAQYTNFFSFLQKTNLVCLGSQIPYECSNCGSHFESEDMKLSQCKGVMHTL